MKVLVFILPYPNFMNKIIMDNQINKNNVKILLVDDELEFVNILKKIIQKNYSSVRTVNSGKKALEAIEENPPDLVITDICMPGIDGLELMRRTTKRYPETKFIGITAYDSVERAIEFLKDGGIDYLHKPFDMNSIYLSIENALNKINLQAHLKEANEMLRQQNIALNKEINERKAVEAHLRKTQNELQLAKNIAEKANQTKTEFLAKMSHELRTPLNGILGYTQILNREKDPQPELQKRAINIIHSCAEHLLLMINDILDVSKIEVNHTRLEPAPFSLTHFLQNTADIAQVKAREHQIEFDYQLLTDIPKSVIGDNKCIRQVLMNLLNNAIKYTQKGRVILRVNYTNSMLECFIEDTGIGIQNDQLDLIFEPFKQINDKRIISEGTGLGLSISRQLVQMMGGEIFVESKLNVGSLFWFKIPLKKTDEIIKSDTDAEKRHRTGYLGSRKRILVVDDSENNLTVLEDILASYGFVVRSAKNGHEGIKIVLDWQPHMVIMDLILPKMDGYEATRRIRETACGKSIPILACSATDNDLTRQLAISAGCNDFIGKPIECNSLLDHMGKLLPIQWEYETIKKSQPEAPKKIIPPSVKELNKLNKLTTEGDVIGIQEWAQNILEKNSEYNAFGKHILELAHQLQLQRIQELLSQLKTV
ncbi:multi-sensor hybrid histidine kinase [Candidatus Magnetomorum sp. HK-1]|nr:multi-sensor hybrid histidine kinase [Candidatus Magnetomorum sp. HK-1]